MRYAAYNKYRAKKAVCSKGHTHDSKAEAYRCDELHLLQKAGEITDLEIQKDYILIPALYKEIVLSEQYKVGERKGQHKTKRVCEEQQVVYRADFVYFDKQKNKTVIEDCKGVKTKEYIIKRKLMKQKYCDDDTIFIET